MSVMDKASMFGNPFIGIFAKTNDSFTLAGIGTSEKFIRHLDILKTKIIPASIFDSDLLGLYSIMNNKGILITSLASEKEIEIIKKNAKGVNVGVLKTRLNALGNHIAANDHGAVINPDMGPEDAKKIADILDVEVVRSTIAGYKNVGAVVLATNNGFIAHPKASEDEIALLRDMFNEQGGIGTANTGIPFLSISIIANKNGFVIGEQTTGYESHRINDCLGFI